MKTRPHDRRPARCEKWPSPADIRRRCEKIQQNWSPNDRLTRAGVYLGDRIVFVPPEERLLHAILTA